ncbi:MAG: hypothetical protein VB130_01015, partial [Clostridium sp.]|nr:hypothetical protein [Clostridium sp.]
EDLRIKIESIKENTTQVNQINTEIDLIIDSLKDFYSAIDGADIEKKKYLISTLLNKITWDSSTGDVGIQLWGSTKR